MIFVYLYIYRGGRTWNGINWFSFCIDLSAFCAYLMRSAQFGTFSKKCAFICPINWYKNHLNRPISRWDNAKGAIFYVLIKIISSVSCFAPPISTPVSIHNSIPIMTPTPKHLIPPPLLCLYPVSHLVANWLIWSFIKGSFLAGASPWIFVNGHDFVFILTPKDEQKNFFCITSMYFISTNSQVARGIGGLGW